MRQRSPEAAGVMNPRLIVWAALGFAFNLGFSRLSYGLLLPALRQTSRPRIPSLGSSTRRISSATFWNPWDADFAQADPPPGRGQHRSSGDAYRRLRGIGVGTKSWPASGAALPHRRRVGGGPGLDHHHHPRTNEPGSTWPRVRNPLGRLWFWSGRVGDMRAIRSRRSPVAFVEADVVAHVPRRAHRGHWFRSRRSDRAHGDVSA